MVSSKFICQFGNTVNNTFRISIQHFVGALICHFSALDHGLSFSKLPENPKIFDIGSRILKLWRLKDKPPPPPPTPFNQWFGNSFGYHNLNSVDPISMILQISESLERYLLNGVIKVQIKVFANLAIP